MWFTENAWPPILIAGLVSLVFLAMWNSSRRGRYLVAGLCCLLLGVGFHFLEQAIVTDAERLQQRVVALCDDFRHQRPDTVNYVSKAAPEIKAILLGAMALVKVHDDLRLTDFSTKLSNKNSRGSVHFRANATLSVVGYGDVGHQPARFILTFRREEGEWKIIDIERLHPLTGEKMHMLAREAG